MTQRVRLLAGLSLFALAVLALAHPALAAAVLLGAAVTLLVQAIRRERTRDRRVEAVAATPGRIRRILVPVDFSLESVRALEYARAIAARSGGDVFVLSVIPPYPGTLRRGVPGAVREARRQARAAMQAFLRACGGSAGCQVVFAEGTPFAAVLDEARRFRVDLIVLGPRGSGGAEAIVLGRTAAEVVRRANVPVLTVAGAAEAAAGGGGPAAGTLAA